MSVVEVTLLLVSLQLVGLIILTMQLYLMRKDRLALHERTRKQSTIENAGPLWGDARLQLETRFGRDPLATKQAQEIFDDKELKAYVDKLLGTVEHISVGINTGIYDKDILYRMSSTSIIETFRRYKSYIMLRRNLEGSEMYTEFECVANEFSLMRQKKPYPLGNIMHSKDL